MGKVIKRELIKVDNGDGSCHYVLSKPIEVDIDKEFPKKYIRELFIKLLSKLLFIEPTIIKIK